MLRGKETFTELVQFKKSSGHCRVPVAWPRNPRLAIWVARQRRARRRNRISRERIQRLSQLGFPWGTRSGRSLKDNATPSITAARGAYPNQKDERAAKRRRGS